MVKKTAVVICPGRGTYNKSELGYLHQYHSSKINFINSIDQYRKERNQAAVWDLDGMMEYSNKDHVPGENSASLIFGCSYSDFLDINQEKIEILAVAGNSMGWYISCVCAGALNVQNGIHVINTMGSQMKDEIIGGQIIYPEVDENWIFSKEQSLLIDSKIAEINNAGEVVYTSIFFGGFRVIGGTVDGLRQLMKALPVKEGRYPFKLMGNAAFHTPLLSELSQKSKKQLSEKLFTDPKIPLIDGRGKIWMPKTTNVNELWNYTLGHQIDNPYHFTRSIEVAVKEFAPDYLILTGPGMTLGGAVAQILINKKLKPIKNKDDFKKIQLVEPYILSMAEPMQRKLVI